MEEPAPYCACYKITLALVLAGLNLAICSGYIPGAFSRFNTVRTTSAIDQNIVNTTYTGTDTSLKCAVECFHLSTVSLYYDEAASTCYCNNQDDSDITEDVSGTTVYGYLIEHGNISECQEAYNRGHRLHAVYTLGTGRQVLCNMASLGWVVFQRRFDGSVEFVRNWADYVAGFGDAAGEFWLGLETLHQMTEGGCELHVYLEAEPNHDRQDWGYARFSNFSVGSGATNYRLYVDGFSGNVIDSLSLHNNSAFSTYDADNDGNTQNCANRLKGGWWYMAGPNGWCLKSNLNSVYLGGYHQSPDYAGIRWHWPWGKYYSLFRTEMAFRC